MNKILTILFILISFIAGAQKKKDLIVTLEGDSILCSIDSIDSDYIYFVMIKDALPINSKVLRKSIRSYEENAYRTNDFKYEHGSSKITGPYSTMYDINKNYIYYSTTIFTNSIHYERTFIHGAQFSSGISAGIGIFGDINNFGSEIQVNFSVFGPLNNVEFGPGIFIFLNNPYSSPFYNFHAAYKYLGTRGFLFKISPMIVYYSSDILPDIFPWFMISVGYNF